jgi:hypothetical protein
MAASSDVESELSRLKGEITASAPKQLEGAANGSGQGQERSGQGQEQSAPYAPPPPPQAQAQAQAQPAGIPASDLPAAEPQDGEGP